MSRSDPFAPWAEVDLDAVDANVRAIRRRLAPGARLMVAVKADGYGHGAVGVARTALAAGATALGVARFDEGLSLRDAGIEAPILIFGATAAGLAADIAAHRLAVSVGSLGEAAALAAGLRRGQQLDVHLAVDTGMGRRGIPLQGLAIDDAARIVAADIGAIRELGPLRLIGLATHFADAERGDDGGAADQLRLFAGVVRRLRERGLCPPLVHAANSAATLGYTGTHFDLVRVGLAAYGLDPFPPGHCPLPLRPSLALKGRILQCKTVPRGACISYGRTWRAERPTVIATVPLGYADGYRRALSGRAEMLVGGQRAAVVGRVCMDLCMLDLGPRPSVGVGDEVVAIGPQGEDRITAEELAHLADTIPYEIVTGIGHRVRREHYRAPRFAAEPTVAIAC